jgi:hypothetical protein
MNDEMAAVRQTEQSGGNEASICNRNKEMAGYITLHFWLSQLVFASLYSTSILFFHLIKWAMSQYRFIVTRLGGH